MSSSDPWHPHRSARKGVPGPSLRSGWSACRGRVRTSAASAHRSTALRPMRKWRAPAVTAGQTAATGASAALRSWSVWNGRTQDSRPREKPLCRYATIGPGLSSTVGAGAANARGPRAEPPEYRSIGRSGTGLRNDSLAAHKPSREGTVMGEQRRQRQGQDLAVADDDASVDHRQRDPAPARRTPAPRRRRARRHRRGPRRRGRRRRGRRRRRARVGRCRRGRAPPRRRGSRAAAPSRADSACGRSRPAAAAAPAGSRPADGRQSFDALPSTPRPTRTPASSIARTGAMPDARRMFDVGQCATPVRVAAKRSMPAGSSLTQCACQTSGPIQPSDSAYSAGVQPKRSRL